MPDEGAGFCFLKHFLQKRYVILIKFDLIETKFSVRKINHSNMSNMCATCFSDLNVNQGVIGKLYQFSRNLPKFYIFTEILFLNYNYWQLADQLHVHYKFHVSSLRGILFSILPS